MTSYPAGIPREWLATRNEPRANVLDMTPGGRGNGSDFPALHYE